MSKICNNKGLTLKFLLFSLWFLLFFNDIAKVSTTERVTTEKANFNCDNDFDCRYSKYSVSLTNLKEKCGVKDEKKACCRVQFSTRRKGDPKCCSDENLKEYEDKKDEVTYCLSEEAIACYQNCESEFCKKYFIEIDSKCELKSKSSRFCKMDEDCFPKLFCQWGQCQWGERPNNREEGQKCKQTFQCRKGLVCVKDPITAEEGICSKADSKEYLQPCFIDQECRYGLKCLEVPVKRDDIEIMNQYLSNMWKYRDAFKFDLKGPEQIYEEQKKKLLENGEPNQFGAEILEDALEGKGKIGEINPGGNEGNETEKIEDEDDGNDGKEKEGDGWGFGDVFGGGKDDDDDKKRKRIKKIFHLLKKVQSKFYKAKTKKSKTSHSQKSTSHSQKVSSQHRATSSSQHKVASSLQHKVASTHKHELSSMIKHERTHSGKSSIANDKLRQGISNYKKQYPIVSLSSMMKGPHFRFKEGGEKDGEPKVELKPMGIFEKKKLCIAVDMARFGETCMFSRECQAVNYHGKAIKPSCLHTRFTRKCLPSISHDTDKKMRFRVRKFNTKV